MATTSNLQLIAPSSSSSSSWDVLLSFCGQDTRAGFISHLYFALDQAAFRTFMDDPELEKGQQISSGLLDAIRDSKMFVVVLSENYARSTWCLDELVEILGCKRTENQVIPVFYYVDPSDLRHQKGSFGEALDYHKKRYSIDMIEKWRSALAEISNLSGYHLKKNADENESDTIRQIVENVSTKVVHIEEYLFGVDRAVEDIYQKLSFESNDVRAIGVCGMGGIGKTTTARAFYNRYSNNFDISSFIENVKQHSKGSSPLLSLLEQLLSELFKRKDYKIRDVESGIRQLKKILSSKKALIVLDDLDKSSHSELLVRICNLFSDGSRIIVTTRDVYLLNQLRVDMSEVYIYKVKELGPKESLELFNYHAFGKTTPPENLRELSVKIVNYVKGLPLALKVLGSSLRDRTDDLSYWKAQLQKVRINPEIHNILKLSYDELSDRTEKAIFLDIVFFFIGKDKDEGVHVFRSCNFCPEAGIPILVERCLITVDKNNTFQVHTLIQDMGREVMLEESKHGKSRRLYLSHGNACHTLQNLEGTDTVEGLILNLTRSERHLTAKIFERFLNLRLLEIIDALDIKGNFENSFHELRCIRWSHCPWTCLPISFRPQKLVSLDMPFNKFKTLPKGIMNLKIIDVSYSKNLKTVDDFRDLRLVEKLSLSNCRRLLEIHPSIVQLSNLNHLDLGECHKLKELPEHAGQLSKLGHLDLRECHSLKRLPEPVKNLTTLGCLNMSGCHNLIGLPEQLGDLKVLKKLDVSYTSIARLPDSIAHLKELVKLRLIWCKKLRKLPEHFGDIESLGWFDARHCAIEQLPDSFGRLTNLVNLQLACCKNLTSLPHSIWNLKMLKNLNLSYCINLEKLPEQLGMMQCLESLNAYDTAIEEIPGSIGLLSRLQILICGGRCTELKHIPNSIKNLASLEVLEVMISGLSTFNFLDIVKDMKWEGLSLDLNLRCDIRLLLPVILDISSIRELTLTDEVKSFSSTKPFSLSKLFNLRSLRLGNCRILGSFPEVTQNLEDLMVRDYATLEQLPDLSGLRRLKELRIWNCISLQSIPPIPPHLQLLQVIDCTSVQDLPDWSVFKEMNTIWFSNCRNLKSISLKQSHLQVGPDSSFKAHLPNREIAEWFSYKSKGCTISFNIPTNLGDDFLGVALWIVNKCKSHGDFPFIEVVVTNETEGFEKNYAIHLPLKPVGEVSSTVECIRSGGISTGVQSRLQQRRDNGEDMSMKSGDKIKMPPKNRNQTNVNVSPAQLAQMISQAVTQAIQQAFPNQGNQGNHNGQGNQGNQNGQGNQGDQGNQEGQGNQLEPFAWLERFLKQKPESFHSAPTPIEAENWIVHLEKIFDALGCDDSQKVKLAVYKLEGDAQRWWRGVKTIKGEEFIEALTWPVFTELFYEQYFSNADREAYLREFHSISQNHDETITDYMARFIRLAGFAGTIAGNAAQQTEKFKWGLKLKLRGHIISLKFPSVAEVADAAKDIEKERSDFRAHRFQNDRKRGRDDQGSVQGKQWNGGHGNQQGQWRGRNQYNRSQSTYGQNQYGGQKNNQQFQQQPRQWQNRQQGQGRYSVYGGNPNMISVAPCAICGGHHPGRACYRQTGACFLCGSMEHRAKDCTVSRNNGDGGSGSGGTGSGGQQN